MAIESQEFRRVLGHFATGVTIVTTRYAGQWFGFTANAFASISLNPPLVMISVGLSNTSFAAIEGSGIFGVNILGTEQEDLARIFATNGPDKYERIATIAHHTAITGAPILDAALGWLDCRIVASYPGGDHQIFLGEVQALDARDGQPLLYYRGQYRRLKP